jgi:hypothetical protein
MVHSSIVPVVTVHGGLSSPSGPPTILGQASARIPTAGKIRAGIKVLSRRAAEQPQACAIYERGVAEGHSFERIEQSIAEALPAGAHEPTRPAQRAMVHRAAAGLRESRARASAHRRVWRGPWRRPASVPLSRRVSV